MWWLNAAHRDGRPPRSYFGWVRHFDPILGAEVGWWWVLGIVVFVTERWPVELEFRRSSHSFSLTDIPLTLALVFTSGTHAFVADHGRHAGRARCCAALPPVKFAFNLAQFALVTLRADRHRARWPPASTPASAGSRGAPCSSPRSSAAC